MDRRKVKTKKILKQTLAKMMMKQDFRKITVTELSEQADINRGTFYLHYLDIYDMIDKIETETIDAVNNIIDHHKKEIVQNNYFPLIIEIAEYFKKDKDLYKALLSQNGDINFLNRIKEAMKITFFKNNTGMFKDIKDKALLSAGASFIISGGIGIFQEWLDGNCSYPAEKLVAGLVQVFIKAV